MTQPVISGYVTGGVRTQLRLEGLAIFLGALYLNTTAWGVSWGSFALYFLLPDLSFLGYLAGPRFGAIAYNIAHSCIGPVVCIAIGLHFSSATWLGASIIWFAHIGFDRALGYGLKYPQGFSHTHLGRIGRKAHSAGNPTLLGNAAND